MVSFLLLLSTCEGLSDSSVLEQVCIPGGEWIGFIYWAGTDLGLFLLVLSFRLGLSVGFSSGSGENQGIRQCWFMSFPSLGMSVPKSTDTGSFSATAAVTGSDTPSMSSLNVARGYVTISP